MSKILFLTIKLKFEQNRTALEKVYKVSAVLESTRDPAYGHQVKNLGDRPRPEPSHEQTKAPIDIC